MCKHCEAKEKRSVSDARADPGVHPHASRQVPSPPGPSGPQRCPLPAPQPRRFPAVPAAQPVTCRAEQAARPPARRRCHVDTAAPRPEREAPTSPHRAGAGPRPAGRDGTGRAGGVRPAGGPGGRDGAGRRGAQTLSSPQQGKSRSVESMLRFSGRISFVLPPAGARPVPPVLSCCRLSALGRAHPRPSCCASSLPSAKLAHFNVRAIPSLAQTCYSLSYLQLRCFFC